MLASGTRVHGFNPGRNREEKKLTDFEEILFEYFAIGGNTRNNPF
jgi:hypothetical protein